MRAAAPTPRATPGGVARERTHLHNLGRAPVVRLELVPGQRPAAARYPGATLEVRVEQRQRLASPARGRAAEHAKAQIVNTPVRQPHHGGAVELLYARIGRPPAALEHQHPQGRSVELSRDRDAGRPAPDDAHIRREPVVVHGSEIANHRGWAPACVPKRRPVPGAPADLRRLVTKRMAIGAGQNIERGV